MDASLLDLFAAYNEAIWPWQIVAYLLGIVAMGAIIVNRRGSTRVAAASLGLLWLWNGLIFFPVHFVDAQPASGSFAADLFTSLQPGASFVFAVLFTLQGGLFLFQALRPTMELSCACKRDPYNIVGLAGVLYATVGYPLMGLLLGHNYPQMLLFGVLPCPTAVFTVGVFLLTDRHVPRLMLVVPLLWSILGIMPVMLGVWEDVGLILFGIGGTALLLYRDAVRREPTPEEVVAAARVQ